MASFNKLFQDEVRRLARKELRDALGTAQNENIKLRKSIAQLRQRIQSLERTAAKLQNQPNGKNVYKGPGNVRSRRAHITGKAIKQVRKRLRLTQAEFGKLLGVTGQSVYQWERRDDALRLRHATEDAYQKAKLMGLKEARELLDSSS